jgi:hypothetical protein
LFYNKRFLRYKKKAVISAKRRLFFDTTHFRRTKSLSGAAAESGLACCAPGFARMPLKTPGFYPLCAHLYSAARQRGACKE